MKKVAPEKITSIKAYHSLMGLAEPVHPQISLIDLEHMTKLPEGGVVNVVLSFYSIALKKNFNGKIKYGQQDFDFDEGMLIFMSPGQVLKIESEGNSILEHSGWLLLVHPDFLWNYSLAQEIKQYDFFDYAVNEALHLSEAEEDIVRGILSNIDKECIGKIDQLGAKVIVNHIGLLLSYADRFYHRQFITRKPHNHLVLHRLEALLEQYFSDGAKLTEGIPSVQLVADCLHMSPNYLSGLLKTLTGKSTQQHIQDKLIEYAKQKLSTTSLTVSQIAYDLGFEHSQSFSKLFKNKTNLSPQAFRHTFK